MDNKTLIERLRTLANELTGIADHAAVTNSSDDPGNQAERLVNRFLDIVDNGRLDELRTVAHPDIVYIIPGRSRISGIFEGIDATVQAMSVLPRAGARDLRTKLTHLVATGDSVATFHELSGTVDDHTHTVELALRYEIRDGLISRITEYSANQYDSDDIFA